MNSFFLGYLLGFSSVAVGAVGYSVFLEFRVRQENRKEQALLDLQRKRARLFAMVNNRNKKSRP